MYVCMYVCTGMCMYTYVRVYADQHIVTHIHAHTHTNLKGPLLRPKLSTVSQISLSERCMLVKFDMRKTNLGISTQWRHQRSRGQDRSVKRAL